MKLPSKYIALLVILSLASVFVYQAYWLINLYQTQQHDISRNIAEAMRLSDYNEMIVRLQHIRSESLSNNKLTVYSSFDGHGDHIEKRTITSIEKGDTTNITLWKDSVITEKEPKASLYAKDIGLMLGEGNAMSQLTLNLQRGIHAGLDLLKSPDFAVYDSLLTIELHQAGIHRPYRLEYFHKNSTLDSSLVFVDTIAVINKGGYLPSSRALTYEYSYDIHNNWSYCLTMEPTNGIVLKQMTGILATSAINLIILCFSFGFLVRTLLRQRTLEEMKSDFTNNITHELKTPIAVAYAANDALLHFDTNKDPAKRERYLRICQEQLRKLSGLVEQILSMSMERRKTFRLQLETFAPAEAITPLIEQHKLKARKPVDIRLHTEPADLTVTADRTHFCNIVSNLIDNAIKYSPRQAEVEIRCTTKEGEFILSVSDHGMGIAHDKQSRIFDKFYRVPTGNLHDVKGYGLGLFYVKTLVEKHGGTIEIESEPGKGSTFTIKLKQKP